MELKNTTHLDTDRLARLFVDGSQDWPIGGLRVAVRYSRGASYSGTCYYNDGRIYINLGRRNRYPLAVQTHIARARSNATHWWRDLHTIQVADAYQLTLFVYLHELYHWLVRRAGRNVRQKESRCDRFAVRWLVDRFGLIVGDSRGRPVERGEWDFQDLDGFVAAARRPRRARAVLAKSRPRLQGPAGTKPPPTLFDSL